MKYTKINPPLQCMMTHSAWYRGGISGSKPIGVLWHDTGVDEHIGAIPISRFVQPYEGDADYAQLMKILGNNPNNNDWNHTDRQAGVNAFVGRLADNSISSVQVGPWTMAPWGCGAGPNGSCNGFNRSGVWTGEHWIQFEICDDGYNSRVYFDQVFEEACQLTAYLCDTYKIDPKATIQFCGVSVPAILCHQDSYQLGLGNDHSDVLVWFRQFGKTMADVRNRVSAILSTASLDLSSTMTSRRNFAMAAETVDNSTTSYDFIQNCSTQLSHPAVSTSSGSCESLMSQSAASQLGVVFTQYTKDNAQVGDILCICNAPTVLRRIDYLAVVTEVLDLQVKAISNAVRLTDNSQIVKQTTLFSYDDSRILYVYRPAFDLDIDQLDVDAFEAALREFASLNQNNEPSILSSGLGLSRINYDDIANFRKILSGVPTEQLRTRVIDMMMSIPRLIIDYLCYNKFTIAASIGICANTYYDSGWNAEHVVNNALGVPSIFGLCAWRGDRAKALQSFNKAWQTSLSVQLDYMMLDMKSNYSDLYAQALSATDPVVYTKLFYQNYYDTPPAAIESRTQVAELLWSMTRETSQSATVVQTSSTATQPIVQYNAYTTQYDTQYKYVSGNILIVFTESDVDMLGALVTLEAGAESYECQTAVASVVINRMVTGNMSLHDVIYQPYQFSVASKVASTTPLKKSREAALDVILNGTTIPRYVTYFRADYYHRWGDNYVPWQKIDRTYFSYEKSLKEIWG